MNLPSRTTDIPWLQPYPDHRLAAGADPASRSQSRATIELAFVAALQALPPRQMAALLLCDVIGFSVAEVATMLDTTPTAIKGVLQRARAAMPSTPPARADAEETRMARRFAEAFAADDVAGVVALLTDDAWLAMPPAPHEYRGADAVRAFLAASAAWRAGRRYVLQPTRANAQPALACYLPAEGAASAEPAGLLVLTITPDGIAGITRFLDADLHRHFGLPAQVAVGGRATVTS